MRVLWLRQAVAEGAGLNDESRPCNACTQNEAVNLNRKEVVEEDKRKQLPANWESKKRRVEWELEEENARKVCLLSVLRSDMNDFTRELLSSRGRLVILYERLRATCPAASPLRTLQVVDFARSRGRSRCGFGANPVYT